MILAYFVAAASLAFARSAEGVWNLMLIPIGLGCVGVAVVGLRVMTAVKTWLQCRARQPEPHVGPTMNRQQIIGLVIVFCAGCSPPPSSTPLPGISTRLFDWSLDDGARKGQPGSNDGKILCVFAEGQLAFTVWTDVRSGVSGIGGRGAGREEGHVGWYEDKVIWECQLKSANEGTVTIQGQIFTLEQGNFFLASSRPSSRVVQLQRDVKDWTREDAMKSARSDTEISGFYKPEPGQ